MLFAKACVVCGAPGPSPCASCAARLVSCGPIVPAPQGVERAAALFDYDAVGRQLVRAFKFDNDRRGLGGLGAAMATLVEGWPVDVVTWAPTTAARRRRRGYDQAELLARRLARSAGWPCRRALRRAAGEHQTGRCLADRTDPTPFVPIVGLRGRVLVVDDVLTTGATLSAATAALRAAGVTEVSAAVLARTPPPGARGAAHHLPASVTQGGRNPGRKRVTAL